MNQKHTIGPWDVSTHADNDEIVIRSPKGIIANLDCDRPYDLITKSESEANAKLMAAAKDLLQACTEFCEKVESGKARSVKSYKQMKEAIKKATD
jgi:hypothetical protein